MLQICNNNAIPILTWAGTTSGFQNLLANPTIDFTALSGVYTFFVNRTIQVNYSSAAPGGRGGDGAVSANGGFGGSSGAVNTGTLITLFNGIIYEIGVGETNVTVDTYLKISSGVDIHRLTGVSVVTGSGIAGASGGNGGIYNSVSPSGGDGSTNGGAGGGGGGGTSGSIQLGGGGSGGGTTNGTSAHGSAPGFGDIGGNGISVIIAGINCAYGGGGGSSSAPGFPATTGTPGGPAAIRFVFSKFL